MEIHRDYIKSAMFGFTDALVSTTGVIVGVSTGTSSKSIAILAGIVTILVESMSMGSGEYLSAKAAHQFDKNHNGAVPLTTGLVMFCSYFVAGLVPLTPILLFPIAEARNIAIGAALVALFVLGYFKGKIVGEKPISSALEVFVIGGVTTIIGIIAGNIFKIH